MNYQNEKQSVENPIHPSIRLSYTVNRKISIQNYIQHSF